MRVLQEALKDGDFLLNIEKPPWGLPRDFLQNCSCIDGSQDMHGVPKWYLFTAKWIPYYLIKPKHDNWLSVDLAEFTCCEPKIVLFLFTEQFFVRTR